MLLLVIMTEIFINVFVEQLAAIQHSLLYLFAILKMCLHQRVLSCGQAMLSCGVIV